MNKTIMNSKDESRFSEQNKIQNEYHGHEDSCCDQKIFVSLFLERKKKLFWDWSKTKVCFGDKNHSPLPPYQLVKTIFSCYANERISLFNNKSWEHMNGQKGIVKRFLNYLKGVFLSFITMQNRQGEGRFSITWDGAVFRVSA